MISIEEQINYLQQVPQFGRYLADALRKLQEGTNNLGQNIAVDPAGTIPPPPPVQQLDVKTNGTGMVHAVISDHNQIQKGIHYFVEYANDPDFLQPHVVHLGASRSMTPVNLPAKDDNGVAQRFYFRAYSQYPGGHPGPAVHFGGAVPSAVDPGGTQALTLIPSTGSGTAQNSGEQGSSGFGKVLFRPATSSRFRVNTL